MANDASMVAVAAACSKLGCDITDIELCSIGAGSDGSNTQKLNQGSFLSWGAWVLNAMLDGAASSMHEYFVRSLPLKKYTRIEFIKDSGWSMDNPRDMLRAEKAWDADIKQAIEIVGQF